MIFDPNISAFIIQLKIGQLEIKLDPECVEAESSSLSSDIRTNKKPGKSPGKSPLKNVVTSEESSKSFIVPEFPFVKRPPRIFDCEPTDMPEFLYIPNLKVRVGHPHRVSFIS